VTRVDADAVTGILRATTEHDGTLLLLGWIGPDPGAVTVADAVVERARCATVLARLSERGGGAAWPRVVVAVDAEDLGAGGLPGMRLGLAVAAGLSRDTGARMVVLAERDDEVLRAALAAVGERDARVVIDDRRRAVALAALLADRDLLVVPAAPDDRALHGPVARLARALPDVDLLVAVDHVPATAGAGLSRR
jgi:hypothetical protein